MLGGLKRRKNDSTFGVGPSGLEGDRDKVRDGSLGSRCREEGLREDSCAQSPVAYLT